MVKDTLQSLKLENDKLKDKIQEIFVELCNLRDAVKAERNGGNEGTNDGNTKSTLNNIQDDFISYVNDRISSIEIDLDYLSSRVVKISSSLDQTLEYSYSYNIKLVGVPEVRQQQQQQQQQHLLCPLRIN